MSYATKFYEFTKLQPRQNRLFAARIMRFLQVILYGPSSHTHVSLETV